ncbi:unnamed protein product [Leptidea sinapis]|uniref:Uncharacterized protein n=1 Tax=Leptidea sinapis TaxID=189913 RepID=A0A5E4PRH8_9NEOP|nr:unnamed protein product [Leptidea sinapis]
MFIELFPFIVCEQDQIRPSSLATQRQTEETQEPLKRQDRSSNLSVPARWEDRNLRNYLNSPKVEKASRWIGGIYDYGAKSWKWGGELRLMRYQSFSKMKKLTPEELQWTPRSCFEPRQYICQTKLEKVPKSKLKEVRLRYQTMGKINEITAPSVSTEVDDPRNNEVTSNPVANPKSYDLRPSPLRRVKRPHRNETRSYGVKPSELRRRSRPTIERRLKKPFPGYRWNRRDPEGSYRYNVELLNSGRTGLSPQQVKYHLSRVKRIRNKQLARRRRLRENEDWLVNDPRAIVQTHVRTYTVDNNISALHPKTIVEEFDMMAPPAPMVMPRPARNIW